MFLQIYPNQSIKNVESNSETYLLWNSLCGSEYFLVENRQQTSYDTYLPGNGLCIYHIDNSVNNNNNEWYPGHTSSGHYHVALEQADGLWNLEHNNNVEMPVIHIPVQQIIKISIIQLFRIARIIF